MKHTRSTKRFVKNDYFTAIFWMTAVFLIACVVTVASIENHFVNQAERKANYKVETFELRLNAKGLNTQYIQELKRTQIQKTMNALLLLESEYSNELFLKMLESVEISRIEWWDNTEQLVYSAGRNIDSRDLSKYLASNQTLLIDEIEDEFMMVYQKGSNGILVIEMDATSFAPILEQMSVSSLMREFSEDEDVFAAYFIGLDDAIAASFSKEDQSIEWLSQWQQNEAKDARVYSPLKANSSILEVSSPIRFQDQEVGTLVFYEQIFDVRSLITRFTWLSVLTLLALFFIVLGLFMKLIAKNREITKLHFYDRLTKLPNKEYLLDLLLNDQKRHETIPRALVMVKVSRLSSINMLQGYPTGDEVLVEFTKHLNEYCQPDRVLSRYTGHYFVFYLKHIDSKNDLDRFIAQIMRLDSIYIASSNHHVNLGIHVGALMFSNMDDSIESLFQSLDVAMNMAKRKEGIMVSYYDKQVEEQVLYENQLVQEMKQALLSDSSTQFYMMYQPIVSKSTLQVHTYEALCRFNSETYGSISPEVFIRLAEEHHLIIPLGYNILSWVINDMANSKKKHQFHRISVNLSLIQLLQVDFVDQVLRMIRDKGLSTSQFEFEITESLLEKDFNSVNQKLKELHDAGIYLAIDDFGTGYSSLSRIKELNVDCIKIDQSFMATLAEFDQKSIVEDIILMAHRLGYEVVAEGVETQGQVDKLVELGCDYLQGYYFDRPKPWDQL